MFKQTEDENVIRTLDKLVEVTGHETIPANSTIPKGHRLWATYEAWLAAGNSPEPCQTQKEAEAATKQHLTAAVQSHLDETARQRNYDNIMSLCTYATSTNPTFSAEGQAGVEWRDSVWSMAYQLLAEVESGQRDIPSEGELLSLLPDMAWP